MDGGKLLRLNMSNLKVWQEPVPEQYRLLGGRSLTSRLIFDEVRANCDPFGPDNKVVLAPGFLSGTGAPCSGRMSVGGKSPLTGGIKESNVGGTASNALARLNIRGIVVEGKPVDDSLYVLVITPKGIHLEKNNSLRYLNTYSAVTALMNSYGNKISVICIGPAGESQSKLATIAVTEHAGYPSRHAARGALGAVLGSKGIKAIIISTEGCRKNIFDKNKFTKLAREYHSSLAQSKSVLREHGTAALLSLVNELGGLPTRNFSQGRFEQADSINATALKKLITSRNGKSGVFCHAGCPIRCSNIFNDKHGKFVTASLEYETIAMMGSNLGIDSLDSIARMDRICDEAGMDTIETAVTLGVLMDAGVLRFGDSEAAIDVLLGKSGGNLVRLLSSGAFDAGHTLKHNRIPTVRKQAIAAYDPRVIVGTGLTYATSPMGADHTAGNVLPGRAGYRHKTSDPNKAEAWELSHDLQVMTTVCDSLGFCFFVGPTKADMVIMSDLVTAFIGEDIGPVDLLNAAKSTILYERNFNESAGINMQEDGIPTFLKTEPLPPTGEVFSRAKDVSKINTLMKIVESENILK